MRLVMMGTGPFAVPTLESLFNGEHQLLALVTRPSVVVRTRGKPTEPANPMRALAESRGLTVLAPADVNDGQARRELAALQPDLLVVCDYGQILSPETLSVATLGGINLHGSLLPRYRGAAPIQWAIWNGERDTGVTVIHMTPRLDAGPCLARRTTPIGAAETAAELEPRLARLGVDPVREAVAMLARWDRASPIGERQDPAQATRAPRLKKSDGAVHWDRSADEIFNQFRAVQPWPGLFTYLLRPELEPLRVILEQVQVRDSFPAPCPGTLAVSGGPELWVAAGRGAVAVLRLRAAGGKPLAAAEFLRGHSLEPGSRFGPLPTMQAE